VTLGAFHQGGPGSDGQRDGPLNDLKDLDGAGAALAGR
jgi:hypothetical protein